MQLDDNLTQGVSLRNSNTCSQIDITTLQNHWPIDRKNMQRLHNIGMIV